MFPLLLEIISPTADSLMLSELAAVMLSVAEMETLSWAPTNSAQGHVRAAAHDNGARVE